MKGFNNIGNTCYLNAGLQLILHNQELCYLIRSNNKSNILQILSDFIEEYYNVSKTEALTPNKIKTLVENKNNIFCGTNQQDSSEFIIYFLDLINEEINLNYLYETTTNVFIKCKLRKCLNISQHLEKNNFLIFDIKENFINLDQCYKEYKSKIKFENDNLYWCEKCNTKRVASKRIQIINWPKHLIIILKRFTHNVNNINKNNNCISVPEFWLNKYYLKGIVFHSGSIHGGHYIYIGKQNNNWYMFNDNFVTMVNLNQLDNYKDYGYIYYFEKIL